MLRFFGVLLLASLCVAWGVRQHSDGSELQPQGDFRQCDLGVRFSDRLVLRETCFQSGEVTEKGNVITVHQGARVRLFSQGQSLENVVLDSIIVECGAVLQLEQLSITAAIEIRAHCNNPDGSNQTLQPATLQVRNCEMRVPQDADENWLMVYKASKVEIKDSKAYATASIRHASEVSVERVEFVAAESLTMVTSLRTSNVTSLVVKDSVFRVGADKDGISAVQTDANLQNVSICGERVFPRSKGDHLSRGGIRLRRSKLQASELLATDLRVALDFVQSDVQIEQAYVAFNAVGVSGSLNAGSSMSGFIYMNGQDFQTTSLLSAAGLNTWDPMTTAGTDWDLAFLTGAVLWYAVTWLTSRFCSEESHWQWLPIVFGCLLFAPAPFWMGVVSYRALVAAHYAINDDRWTWVMTRVLYTGLLLAVWAVLMMYRYRQRMQQVNVGRLVKANETQKELQDKKTALLKKLDNREARRQMDALQFDLFQSMIAGEESKAQAVFNAMQICAKDQNDRLANWFRGYSRYGPDETSQGQGHVERWQGHVKRFSKLEEIQSFQSVHHEDLQQHACWPSDDIGEAKAIEILAATAEWLKDTFRTELACVVGKVNDDAPKETETSAKPGYTLQPESGSQWNPGDVLGFVLAPVKDPKRALDKIKGDYEKDYEQKKKTSKPLARYVCDFLRATIYAADPEVLAKAYDVLKKQREHSILRVKNKFGNNSLPAEDRTSILVNLWVKDGKHKLIAEVQFQLQDYMTAKQLSHMYYDVKRAKSAEEIWHKPIFRPVPPEPEEGKEDKPVQ